MAKCNCSAEIAGIRVRVIHLEAQLKALKELVLAR